MRVDVVAFLILLSGPVFAAEPAPGPIVIEPALVHLRSGQDREWATFPEVAGERQLERTFTAKTNADELTLLLRQQDVKQGWNVVLNGTKLGELVRDERQRVGSMGVAIGKHQSTQLMMTLPESPDRAAANAASCSRNGKRWVIAGRMSRPDWSMTVILYQVSYISRP